MAFASALSAAGSLISGFGEKQSANYGAAVARRNAGIARKNAELVTDNAQVEAMNSDLELADLLGQQTAAFGASGLFGKTQALVQNRTKEVGRQDARNIIREGNQQAMNYKQQQSDFLSQSKMLKRQGKFAALTGVLNAGGSLMGDSKITKGGW